MSNISVYLIVILAFVVSSSLINGWKLNQSFKGTFTYYDTVGIGACGKNLNAATEMLVAISKTQWKTANPNADPIYKCDACNSTHIDLSKPAFAKLADLKLGHLNGATIQYVKCPKKM
uniref:Barwin domain-containing protein n=1 Tax=Meloidogyne hapla TaxID=6305 RepID=A0A1I8BT03_MELHA